MPLFIFFGIVLTSFVSALEMKSSVKTGFYVTMAVILLIIILFSII